VAERGGFGKDKHTVFIHRIFVAGKTNESGKKYKNGIDVFHGKYIRAHT
jgi:hypothetical protein